MISKITSNFDIFDFVLTDDDRAAIANVNKNTPYYIATPEALARYAAMKLGEDK